MNQLSDNFLSAANDYRFLLNKAYPQKSVIKLVGDRYQISSVERSMLFRGISSTESSQFRKAKLISEMQDNYRISLDGYNVIRTVGSYLNGKTLFVSTDGFLRDAAEMHRSTLNKKVLNKVVDLIFDFVVSQKIKTVNIYLDQPISKSGELASVLNLKIADKGMEGEALTVPSPDHYLKKNVDGIICTADSVIIENSRVDVFDLAKAVLEKNYQPDFIDLSVLMG